MSRLFGSIRQIAFVVRDLDAAVRYWTDTLGVGPFFALRNVSPVQYRYHGRPSDPPRLHIALGNSGDLQVEIIQQLDERASAYRDFLQAGREGFQHVSAWLTRAEYDATMAAHLCDGGTVAHEGVIPGSGVRFAYFATDAVPGGLLYEIADVIDSPAQGLMQLIADAARGWDGTDPIRELRL